MYSQYGLWCDVMTLVMCISVSVHRGKRTFGQRGGLRGNAGGYVNVTRFHLILLSVLPKSSVLLFWQANYPLYHSLSIHNLPWMDPTLEWKPMEVSVGAFHMFHIQNLFYVKGYGCGNVISCLKIHPNLWMVLAIQIFIQIKSLFL